jgi:hypothetical protein
MKKIILLTITFLFTVSLMAQQGTSLRMNLEKNKVYRFTSSSAQTITQTINGNQQTVDSKTENTVSVKMIDATPDFMITEVRIDTMKSNTNTMGKTSVMSSAVEGNIKSTEVADVMSCIMNRLSKNALYVKIDYMGKPLDVVNAKMLSDFIMKDTSSIALAGPVAAAIKKQIAGMISNDALKTMVMPFTYYLPGKTVATGDTWSVTNTTTSGGMALEIITKYHLDAVNGDNAMVTAESEIKAAANADPIISGPAKVTYDDLKGLSKSSMIIDIRTGLMIEEKAKTHIAGNLGISAPGYSMQMPMDINGESKVTAIK